MPKLFQLSLIIVGAACVFAVFGIPAEGAISDETAECLDCHASIHPGIVKDWQNSRHAATTPGDAMKIKGNARKITSPDVPENLRGKAVGCAECHTLRPDKHADTFEHNGYDIHIVVSPQDCATCHREETTQFADNLMSRAHGNLADNPVYQKLQVSIIGKTTREKGQIKYSPANPLTKSDACYYCHGTKLEVTGTVTRDTESAGELEFPVIKGWPNQGVGRVNLDGSLGSCTACHTRHAFSIEMARSAYTCKECHVGPDVPAFRVYEASKHGNIYSTFNKDWNFKSVPWTVGKDFTAPTCATCHISLVVDTEDEVIVKRSHRMNDRLPWRIYGLIYAHPHPISADTTKIRNADNLPLPADFKGNFAAKYLIGQDEMKTRTDTMQRLCLSCHSQSWVSGHWAQFENTIAETNAETLTATQIIQDTWKKGYAAGLDHGANPFDEAIEKKWHLTWLFYANSIRFSSAMAGGGDYGVFAGGRYQMSLSIAELQDWYNLRQAVEKKK